MDFKIDTKENFQIVIPQGWRLDAALTEAISQNWLDAGHEARQHTLLDLQLMTEADENAAELLAALQESWSLHNLSLVFTGLRPALLAEIRGRDEEEVLNIAPTMDEAIDMISMEILEREIFGEDEPED